MFFGTSFSSLPLSYFYPSFPVTYHRVPCIFSARLMTDGLLFKNGFLRFFITRSHVPFGSYPQITPLLLPIPFMSHSPVRQIPLLRVVV